MSKGMLFLTGALLVAIMLAIPGDQIVLGAIGGALIGLSIGIAITERIG